MRVIRSNVFETNSSSVHTLCIANKNVDMNDFEGMKLFVSTDTYGWSHKPLNDMHSRASYLYTAQVDMLSYKYSVTDKKFKQCLADIQNTWYSILSKYGIDVEFEKLCIDEDYKYLANCSIDHCGNLKDWIDPIINHEHSFLRYLFNDDSIIYISNDNISLDTIIREQNEIDKWLKHHDCNVFEKGN